MIKINTKGLAKFQKDLQLELDRGNRIIGRHFEEWTRKVFEEIAVLAPQYSGDLVSNLNYSVKMPDYTYRETAAKEHSANDFRSFIRKHRGDMLAVGQAMSRMRRVSGPTYLDKVYITFSAPADEGGYLVDKLEGGARVRPINLVRGEVALISYAQVRHSSLKMSSMSELNA